MKKYLLIICVLAFWFTAMGQTKTIDQLPAAKELLGKELILSMQDGATKSIRYDLMIHDMESRSWKYTGYMDYVGNVAFDGGVEFSNSVVFDIGATFQDACNFYNMPSIFWMGFTSHYQTTIDTVYIGREYLRPTEISADGYAGTWDNTLTLSGVPSSSYIQITGGADRTFPLVTVLSIRTITAGKDGEILTVEYDGVGRGMNFTTDNNIKLSAGATELTLSGGGGSSATFIYSHGYWRLLYTAQ